MATERPLARGHTAHVFDIQPGVHPRFPEATLIRKEPTTPHRESGALTFSLHQVAHALFPQHFARMYGYETITQGPEVMVEAGGMLDYRPIHVFYMEKLPIPADHYIHQPHKAKQSGCQRELLSMYPMYRASAGA